MRFAAAAAALRPWPPGRGRRGRCGRPSDFAGIADESAALGRPVRGGRQGPAAPALRELPPGRRPAAAGRRGPPPRPGRPARRGRHRRRGPALHHLPRPPTTTPPACPATRSGTWRRSRWPGRAGRSARSASRSRTRPATAARTWPVLVEHMAHDSLVGWGWAPGAGREPAPGTQAQFGELIKAWADTGAHCPQG